MPDRADFPVAVLVDGGFFLKRYTHTFGRGKPPAQVADDLVRFAEGHVEENYLYRIFFYDCRPYADKQTHPVTGRTIDFARTRTATERLELHTELRMRRKVALRLGTLAWRGWTVGERSIKDLKERGVLAAEDVRPGLEQKGVDIKIGLDIAHLAHRRLVRRLVLISGDSDFVPATKLARTEGISDQTIASRAMHDRGWRRSDRPFHPLILRKRSGRDTRREHACRVS